MTPDYDNYLEWHDLHFQHLQKINRQVENEYKDVIASIIVALALLNLKKSKPFSFSDYPTAKKKFDDIFKSLNTNLKRVVENGMTTEWNLSNTKNNKLIDRLFTGSISEKAIESLKPKNYELLQILKDRKINGITLSDRVWKYTEQTKKLIEDALSLGIAQGYDKNKLALSVMEYLQNPSLILIDAKRLELDPKYSDELLARIDAKNPGRGVYRSAYNNALRLARNEAHRAYLEANHERWKQYDFIIGYRIERSPGIKVFPCDVCESLKGVYPKDFKFVMWHPSCLCVCIPIIRQARTRIEGEEIARFKRNDNLYILRNEPITDMPSSYNKWIKENTERLINASSTPYFIRDNYRYGNISKGLKFIN